MQFLGLQHAAGWTVHYDRPHAPVAVHAKGDGGGGCACWGGLVGLEVHTFILTKKIKQTSLLVVGE